MLHPHKRHLAVCSAHRQFQSAKRDYDIPLPLLLLFPITSSAKSAKLLAASSIACSYLSLSQISTIFIAEEITNSLSIPAKYIKSLGINNLPVESSSTVFTPAVNLLIKSLFFLSKRFSSPIYSITAARSFIG